MSFYLKLLGAVCVFLCSVFVGFSYSDRLSKRKIFLSGFIDFLTALESNIRYNSSEILTLIKSSASPKLKLLFDFDAEDFNSFWQNFIDKIPKSYGLKHEDINLLYDFGGKLGTTDVEGQLSHISLYKELFTISYNNSLEEYKTKSRLRKMLGIFLGLILTIMII